MSPFSVTVAAVILYCSISNAAQYLHPNESVCRTVLEDGEHYYIHIVSLSEIQHDFDLIFLILYMRGGLLDQVDYQYRTKGCGDRNLSPATLTNLQTTGPITVDPEDLSGITIQAITNPGGVGAICILPDVFAYWYPVSENVRSVSVHGNGTLINSSVSSSLLGLDADGKCFGYADNQNTVVTLEEPLALEDYCYHNGYYYRDQEVLPKIPGRPCITQQCVRGRVTADRFDPDNCPDLSCPPNQRTTDNNVCCPFCAITDHCLSTNPCGNYNSTECVNDEDLGYRCVCKQGYHDNGRGECEDTDECALGTDLCVKATTNCVNSPPGSYSCHKKDAIYLAHLDKYVCRQGFEDNGDDLCVDINECESGAHQCDTGSTKCVNQPGSYACSCLDKVGTYQLNNTHCSPYNLEYHLLDPSKVMCCGHTTKFGVFLVRALKKAGERVFRHIQKVACLEPAFLESHPKSQVHSKAYILETKADAESSTSRSEERVLFNFGSFILAKLNYREPLSFTVQRQGGCLYTYDPPQNGNSTPMASIIAIADYTNNMFKSPKFHSCEQLSKNHLWLQDRLLLPGERLPSDAEFKCPDPRSTAVPIFSYILAVVSSLMVVVIVLMTV